MDIRCATCGEPWDTYHIQHDAVHETPAGLDWCNHEINLEEWERHCNRLGYLVTPKGLVRGDTGFFNLSQKPAPARPKDPHPEKWAGTLTDFWRAQFKLDGWEFGSSMMAVLRCPSCKDQAELPNAAARRANVRLLAELLGDDEDGIAADMDMALRAAEDT